MKNISHSNYKNMPGGVGFSSNSKGQMIPVALEDMLISGSRAQRRFAEKELRKIARAGGSNVR